MSCYRLLIPLLIVAAPGICQEKIPPLASAKTTIDQNSTVMYFAPAGAGREILLLADKPTSHLSVPRSGIAMKFVLTENGAILRGITMDHVMPGAFGSLGTTVFYVVVKERHPECQALDLETGQVTGLYSEFRPFSAAALGGQLAVLGQNTRGETQIRMLSGKGFANKRVYALGREISAQPIQNTLVSSPDGAVLLLDNLEASYVRLELGAGVKAGRRVYLRGSEVEQSKQAKPSRPGRKPRIILAHAAATSGRNLFYLSPYAWDTGYRLAEFDSDGRQTRAYRLELSGGTRYTGQVFGFSPETVAADRDRLVVMSSDGCKRYYRRP